jgi:Uma2 family endonuclease
MATPQKYLRTDPKPYRWTREQYYKMGERGILTETNVELIEGEVIQMSPIYSPHMTSVTLADDVMREVFGKGWVVRVQGPLSLGTDSDPQPDVAVVAGKVRDFKDAHPSTAALVIEVAVSSLHYDRNTKASVYAKAGIKDYWIINVEGEQLEVYRRPIADAKGEYGFIYAQTLIFKKGEFVKPLAKPKALVAVADLLP